MHKNSTGNVSMVANEGESIFDLKSVRYWLNIFNTF